jgi:isoleucyl-tRNA synthetase
MLGNLHDFGPENAVPYEALEESDRWALHQLEDLKARVLTAYETYEFYQGYHALHNFCAVEMSAFYLDIIKDRLYTFAADSRERRAAQTVMAEILVDLVKLTAPVLVYTCDEAWQHLPEHLRTASSVHLTRFPAPKPEHRLSGEGLESWNELLRMRVIVSKALEEARRQKRIGSTLEALVTLVPGDEAAARILESHREQLPWVFIVSKAEIAPVSEEAAQSEGRLLVNVDRAPGEKCVRCWNYKDTVGSSPEHPQLCARCVEQLGEIPG